MLPTPEILLRYNQQQVTLHVAKSTILEDFFAESRLETLPNGYRLQIMLHPKRDLQLQSLTIRYPMPMARSQQVLCNGFQSWSETRLYNFNERPDELRRFARPLMYRYGDYHFEQVPRKKGVLHSWTYGYFSTADNTHFIGSLAEQTAFTLLVFDQQRQEIRIERDVKDLTLQHSFLSADILVLNTSSEEDAFSQYFDTLNLPPLKSQAATGWTSWYNYYTNISQTIIEENLANFKAKNLPINIFQIDDGWQTRVGDWASVKPNFPNGMAALAKSIHQSGFKAGLWLAPFIVEPKAELFTKHPDWLLRDATGKLISVGYSPGWSGKFYALDIYNPAVQDYLGQIFHTVLQIWGFDLVKLDFLYAACVAPRANKTRGQVMHDAMMLLRNWVGEKQILACGVPLGSAFGCVEYCRIGADIHLEWEHRLLKFLRNRERVSTIVALRTTLNRWQLNGRAFHNDPDVFILRKERHKLSETQQKTIFWVNLLLGNLLFCSDVVAEYDDETMALYQHIFQHKNYKTQTVRLLQRDVYAIYFTENDVSKIAFCNLTTKKYVGNNELIMPFETTIVNNPTIR